MSDETTSTTWQLETLKKLKAMGIDAQIPEVTVLKASTENTLYFLGVSLLKREGKYWITFDGAWHATVVLKEILADAYYDVKNGVLDVAELLKKYREESGDVDRSMSLYIRWRDSGILNE